MFSEWRINLNIWLEGYHAAAYEVEETREEKNKNHETKFCPKLAEMWEQMFLLTTFLLFFQNLRKMMINSNQYKETK